MMDEPAGKVVILDAGSQYGKRIDRRIRELNIKSDLMPLSTDAEDIKKANYEAIVISGGPGSVLDESAPAFDENVFKLGIPVLGICYGKQLMVKCFGGEIIKKLGREDGQCEAEIDSTCPIFKGLEKKTKVLLTHGDGMNKIPAGFQPIAHHHDTVVAVANQSEKLYGLQFHPEVDLTDRGDEMMRNFLYEVASIKPDYTMKCRQQTCIDHIKAVVGDKKVLMLLSGGIDSTVSALLLKKALREDQVQAVFINNGYMRKNEPKEVEESLTKLGLNVKMVDATHRFHTATTTLPDKENRVERRKLTKLLCEVTDPEEKRHIIGDTFVEVATDVMKELDMNPDNTFLGQGTLRPDLIESASTIASASADVIKTHHNDSEMVRQWRDVGRVIEPLTDFHKDEVRALGKELGLPPDFCIRHPFPGPGLAIRVICAREPFMGKDFAETQVLIKVVCGYAKAIETGHALAHRVDSATSEHEKEMLMKYSQEGYIGTLLPIRTVGVQGDCRSYNYCAALSCDQKDVNWDAAFFLARMISKVCHNVNRVAFAFGGAIKYPVTEITPTCLTDLVLALARQSDYLAHNVLRTLDVYGKISQMPVVVIPVHFDRDPVHSGKMPSAGRSVVFRPFLSKDFMTGRAAVPNKDIPIEVVNEMVATVGKLPGISRILYDLTSKPPGTTEWE